MHHSHLTTQREQLLFSAGIAEHVEITQGEGGLPKVVLKHCLRLQRLRCTLTHLLYVTAPQPVAVHPSDVTLAAS